MLPRTVAPAFVCQGPVYEIKGEIAGMLIDLLAIVRWLSLLADSNCEDWRDLSGGP